MLLVDDNADRRHLLRSQLSAVGYRVIPVDSGSDALIAARKSDPDFVIADWDLPGWSGPELYQAFCDLPRKNYGYVILMTNARSQTEIADAMQLGVNDVLTTPIAPFQVLTRMLAGERVLQTERELRDSNARLKTTLATLNKAQAAMDRDMRDARKLQQGLVRERTGRFGPMHLSVLLRPAGQIGGDLVGFFPITKDRVGIYALDVSGHGVTAALLTAQLSVHLSGSVDQNVALRAAQTGSDSVKPVSLAHFFKNMMLEEVRTETYFTMVYAELNHATGRLQMVLAGHPHPLLQRKSGAIDALGVGGMPVGLLKEPVFDEIEIQLQPGDRLLISSDGIVEAADPQGRLLGEDGLKKIMQTNAYLSGHSFLESMAWSVSEFSHGERQDDISAVLIEYQEPGERVAFTVADKS